ncbi:hypothetical protein GCM10023092_02060 [Rurimicrobium arvi]|uniref:DUF4142 domain-containing protein n=2 Tax=Rurimicrobium arvi TaxID=2049916 RepID=A0ABP8ME46_9BACT
MAAAEMKDGTATVVTDSSSKGDREFVMKASMGGMMEVDMGRLGVSNGSSQAVRDFGQRMIDDHSKANQELEALAHSKGITPDAMSGKDSQKDMDKLRDKKGADFDKAYMHMMVEDHKKDIDLFQKEADKGDDPELRSWANAKLPTLRDHLRMAQDIENGLKK